MARWSADDKRVISQAKETLPSELKGKLSAYCTHVKHHGGVKKSLRLLTRVIPEFRYAARFDVARYYESIDHAVLLSRSVLPAQNRLEEPIDPSRYSVIS